MTDAFKSRPSLTHTERLKSAYRYTHTHGKSCMVGWFVQSPISSDDYRAVPADNLPSYKYLPLYSNPALVSPFTLLHWSIEWVASFVRFFCVLLLFQEWVLVRSLGRWVLSKGNRYACPTSTQPPPESNASFCTLNVINRRTCLGLLPSMLLLSLAIRIVPIRVGIILSTRCRVSKK